MAKEPLTLDSTCNHCGRTIREHCTPKDGRLWIRPCAASLRKQHPEHWEADTGTADGEYCIQCGWHVHAHYDWEPFAVRVLGKLLMPENPAPMEVVKGWLGCGPDEPDESETGAS